MSINVPNSPQHIRTISVARFHLMPVQPVALAAMAHLQQMRLTLRRQVLCIDFLGGRQDVGALSQCVQKQSGRIQTLLEAGGQQLRDRSERLEFVEGVSQTAFVVSVEVTDGHWCRVGCVGDRMVVCEREECLEEFVDQCVELKVVVAVESTEETKIFVRTNR